MEEQMEMRGGGVLRLRREGTRVHMEAERPEDGKGLYKVWLHGEQGGRLLLGTLAPENGRLFLRRTLSVGALERSGCWPRFSVSAPLAFSFGPQREESWYCEQHPARLLSDPVLRGQLGGPMLCRRDPEGFSLAAPFRPDRPVALSALICLASLERWEGRYHLVWRFDGKGCPRLPHKQGRSGTD